MQFLKQHSSQYVLPGTQSLALFGDVWRIWVPGLSLKTKDTKKISWFWWFEEHPQGFDVNGAIPRTFHLPSSTCNDPSYHASKTSGAQNLSHKCFPLKWTSCLQEKKKNWSEKKSFFLQEPGGEGGLPQPCLSCPTTPTSSWAAPSTNPPLPPSPPSKVSWQPQSSPS